uniref:Uncharacterized protein n=1 Tax=Oryza sativa subsp. japonica TaxID=39947 RepID=Q6Z4C9_ORYSJ|nr:hypothetical protein [Oryza sativa Japonica Group]
MACFWLLSYTLPRPQPFGSGAPLPGALGTSSVTEGCAGAAATCSTPPSSPAELHPRRAVASVVAAGRRHRRKVRGRVEKPGRSLPAVAGHRSPVAAVDRSRAAARPRRRPSSFVVWFEGEYRWVRLVVLYVYMSSKVAADHPISGEVAILVRPLMRSS